MWQNELHLLAEQWVYAHELQLEAAANLDDRVGLGLLGVVCSPRGLQQTSLAWGMR